MIEAIALDSSPLGRLVHPRLNAEIEELPWSQSPAARRQAQREQEGGQDSRFKSTAFTFLLALIAIGLFFAGILAIEILWRGRSL